LFFGFAADEREVPFAFDPGAFDDPDRGVTDFRPDAVAANDSDFIHLALCETSATRRQGDGATRKPNLLIAPSPRPLLAPSYLLLSACLIALSASGAMIL
jgi:hypothetical protein